MFATEHSDYRAIYMIKEDDPKEYFKSTRLGLIYIDADTKIRSLNREAEKLCGINRLGVLGKTAEEAFKHCGHDFMRLFNLPEYEEFCSYNSRVLLTDRSCYIHGDAIRVRDELGVATGIIVVIQDVSTMRATLRQIQTTQLLMSMAELAAGVAHQVRSPLATISGYLQLMLNRLDGDQYTVRRDVIEMLLSEVSHINKVVKELILFASPPLEKSPGVSINRIVDESLLLVFKEIGGENISINKILANGLPTIYADANLLRQAFVNIIQNAVESMPQVGEVTIKTWLHSDVNMLVIAISDVGTGIEPAIMSRLFEPFYTSKLDRMGLGLPVAHRIVSEHGGFLHINANAPVGTKVHVYLPLVDDRMRERSIVHQQILKLQ